MIICDLDGTLWDSSESVVAAWNMEVKRITGVDPQITPDDMRRNMGKTMNEIAEDVFPMFPQEERYGLARRCEVFENAYIAEHGGDLFEGVRETLQQLHAAGVPMAIVSNCQEGYVPAFLRSMDMGRYFIDYEEWGRSGLSKAENIRLVMERNGAPSAVYVGDIQKDADASAEAGVPCIWAAYGFGRIEAPAAVLRSFAELPQALEALGYCWKATGTA
ncbi:MAG: HAD family hydrolase [Mogibacterium sp.]|nr:HAD family hydrolase [Mogibacterium sp.]